MPVTFSNLSSPASITGTTLTITGVGSVTVKAQQPGNDNYLAAADVETTFAIKRTAQTITFDISKVPNTTVAGYMVEGHATSGQLVVFTVVSGPATILRVGNAFGMTVHGGPGIVTVVIKASVGGDSQYEETTLEKSFQVEVPPIAQLSQTISFDVSQAPNVGTTTFPSTGQSSPGLVLTYAVISGPATIQTTGNQSALLPSAEPGLVSVKVRASQAGNDQYEPASLEKTFQFNLPNGIEDASSLITVAPNPATTKLFVRLPSSQSINSLAIKDIFGRDFLNTNAIQTEMTLSVDEFPRGIYIIRLSGDNDYVYHARIILK